MHINLDNYLLGISAETIVVNTEQALELHNYHMMQQARRSIRINSEYLPQQIYGKTEMYRALKGLLLSSRHTFIEILINDTQQIQKHGHALTDLAQKISSRISIKVRTSPWDKEKQQYLLVDDCGYSRQRLFDQYTKTHIDYNDRLTVKETLADFSEAWEQARPATELRRLMI